ncbi:MAG: ABC transporter permease subunit [Candidatus Berkelbacteria bacterium]|nr:ABC transporter permease subunit [Candidatus Berkelbacteria bacterium]
MNIWRHELRSLSKSTLIWTVALSLGVIVFLSMFPAFTKDIETSQKLLNNFPPALRSALGISLKSFFTIYGFFAYLFTFITLAGAIQAMNLGVGTISKEISGKTIDFLLTKPISRAKVISAKLLATLSCLVFTNIIFSLTALICAKIVSTESFSSLTFLLVSATFFLVQLFFLALGSVFTVIISKIKSVIAVSLPTVFAFFVVSELGAILGNENVRYITPFKFFDPIYTINHNAYELRFLLIEIVFVLICILLTYVIYEKKDIRAAA